MLSVQTNNGNVVTERRNGSSHSKYHGYTTGAKKSEEAMGQASASERFVSDFLLVHIAVIRPANTASPATTCGASTCSRFRNTGSLKRNRCTYVPSDPKRTRPWSKKGTQMSVRTAIASTASRKRTRFQYSGNSTKGSNFTPTANANATAATARQRRTSAVADTSKNSTPRIS